MEGFMGVSVKFILFFTNLIVFILSLVVFGVSIWAVVDAPSFLDLFEKAREALVDSGIEVGHMKLGIYSTAAYLLIFAAAVASLVSFLGCCGAAKEHRGMLGTYFVLTLILFILTIVGVVWSYKGDIDTEIKNPLILAMENYQDDPGVDTAKKAYKQAWNNAQAESRCCGVNNVTDWRVVKDFPKGMNKPEGCCRYNRQGKHLDPDEIKECRQADTKPNDKHYNFQGCWTIFTKKIDRNIDVVVGVAIGVIVLMLVNLLLSFGMCMTVD